MQSTLLGQGTTKLLAFHSGLEAQTPDSPHKPALVFLHGFPDMALTFKDQMTRFSPTRHVVSVTLPGYKGSTVFNSVDDYRIDHVAAEIDAILAAQFPQGFDLVGHDFGGLIAWFIAAKGTSKVHTLTVVNAPHPAIYQTALASDPTQQAIFKYVEVFSSPAGEKVCSRDNFATLKHLLFDVAIKDEAEKSAYVESWNHPGALNACLNYYRANGEFLRRGSHDDVVTACPTLVYWGLKDHALSPFNIKGLERFAPRLTLEVRKDLGHWSFREADADFGDTLAKHLASVAPADQV